MGAQAGDLVCCPIFSRLFWAIDMSILTSVFVFLCLVAPFLATDDTNLIQLSTKSNSTGPNCCCKELKIYYKKETKVGEDSYTNKNEGNIMSLKEEQIRQQCKQLH